MWSSCGHVVELRDEGSCARRDPPGLVVNDVEMSLNANTSNPDRAEPSGGYLDL